MSVDVKIIDYNYVFQSNTGITSSSADASFPVANVANEIRAKSWRSSGNFTIDSTNNKIDFSNDLGVTDLVATIDSGTYSPTALATEIVSKMDAASLTAGIGESHVVTYSTTTGKWTITATTINLELYFSTGANVANSIHSSLGFSDVDLTGSQTYTAPKAQIHTEESIVIDLLSTEEVDSFAMLYDINDGIQLTSSAVIKLQGNATLNWSSPAVEVTLSIDEDRDSITHFFSTAQSYRYWRVEIVDAQNTDLYIEVGTVFLGMSETLTRCPDNGFEFSLDDFSQISSNLYGHEYVDSYPIRKELTFSYGIISNADIVVLENMFRRVGTKTPVFVALDSQGTNFDKDQYTVYGRLNRSFNQSHVAFDYLKSGLTVKETS